MTPPGRDEAKRPPRERRWIGRAIPGAARQPVVKVLHAYDTEYAIYGIVLVSALLAVGWKYDTDLEVLVFTMGTVGVFWMAHIYSGVIARHISSEHEGRAIWSAVVDSARHSVGMVLATLLPAFFLLLATVGAMDEYVAYYIALWIGVAVLAVLGYANSARRGSRWPLRLLNTAMTSALGLGIIWLSTLVH